MQELERQLIGEREERRQLTVDNEQLRQQLAHLKAAATTQQDRPSEQLIALEQEIKTKNHTIELLVTEKSELESKVRYAVPR